MAESTVTVSNRRAEHPLVTVVAGIGGGLAAAALTYVHLFLLKAGAITNDVATAGTFSDLLGGARPGDWQVIGWLFFESHNVAVTAEITSTGPTMVSDVSLRDGSLWEPWFLLVPVLALLGVGALLAVSAGASDARSGFRSGSTVALGYVVPVIAGAVLFSWGVSTGPAGYYVAPDLLSGVLIAGVGYPIAFGGLGGAIAART